MYVGNKIDFNYLFYENKGAICATITKVIGVNVDGMHIFTSQ